MITLGNISNFDNISDYLPIITSALIVDLVIIYLIIFEVIKSKSLIIWYNKFGPSAILADVLSIVLGIIIARYLYPFIFKEYSLLQFIFLTVMIQITHDLLFSYLFNLVPRGSSSILDVFKDYAIERGPNILLDDALMMISTIILGSYLTTLNYNNIIILFITMLYSYPYLLYSLK